MVNDRYLVARGGRAKEVMEKWRQDYLSSHRRLVGYMDEIGAIGCFLETFEKPYAFKFPGDVAPKGWTKPGVQGASRPKKTNTEDSQRLENLSWCEPLEIIVPRELGLPEMVNVNRAGGQGAGENYYVLRSGNQKAFTALWTENADGTLGDMILVTPEYARRKAEFERQSDVIVTWRPEGTDPGIELGFEEVSKAEVDLMFSRVKAARNDAESDPYRRSDLVEFYGFRAGDRGTFETEAPVKLKERAAPLLAAGHGFVLWDPEDDEEGLLLIGDSEEELRAQFEAHAQVHFDPPKPAEETVPGFSCP